MIEKHGMVLVQEKKITIQYFQFAGVDVRSAEIEALRWARDSITAELASLDVHDDGRSRLPVELVEGQSNK